MFYYSHSSLIKINTIENEIHSQSMHINTQYSIIFITNNLFDINSFWLSYFMCYFKYLFVHIPY